MNLKVDLSKLKNLTTSSNSFKYFKSLKSSKKISNFLQKIKKIKPSKSLSLSLSKRDFILVSLLVLGLEGYGLYNIFLSSKWQAYRNLQVRYVGDQTIATNFAKDMARKNQYLENLKLLDFKLSELTGEIPSEIHQEEILISLNKIAKASKLGIGGIAFSPISSVSKQDFAAGKISSNQSQKGKVITPSNVRNNADNSQGTTSTSSAKDSKAKQAKQKLVGNLILVDEVSISFSGNYGSLYNFVSALEQSDQRIIVKEVSMVRGDASLLKGTLKIQYVGYTMPEDKSTYTLDTPPVNGKDSPFQAYPGFVDKVAVSAGSAGSLSSSIDQGPAPVKTYNANFYLLISTYDDNGPKIIMGDYTKNGTELYSNLNASVRGKLSISGNQDNMTYTYSLGGASQTKTAKLMLDGGKLRLKVIAHVRKNEQDKVSMILDVDNKTDYPLEINIVNDDKQNPRFSLGTQLGSVMVK